MIPKSMSSTPIGDGNRFSHKIMRQKTAGDGTDLIEGDQLAALRTPLEAVMREAGDLARATARGPFKRWTKGDDDSPVSEGDIAVNDLLRARLGALAPGAGWLSEETADLPDGGLPRAWIVDPIDGTRAYISGRADWTISVALVEHGRPVLAALYAPVTDEMFLAVRGAGAALNGSPIAANRGETLERAKLAGPKRYLDKLAGLQPGMLAQPKVYSLALRLARVAHGELDVAFASPGSHDWDLAAADLLVHEAGGAMTDLAGRPLDYKARHTAHGALVAAGFARHGALIEWVRDRRGEFA
jgi:myo-inositol-1(or 4)-monophosphatase